MTDVPVARPSSTVVLVRDAERAPELFMVRRHAMSAFGAAFAFPGGVIDPDDATLDAVCDGRDDANASNVLGIDKGGMAYFVGAIRELFEETGVLLARCECQTIELQEMRARLNNNAMTWQDFLQAGAARMLCDRLHYFSHWITPDTLPKRYTTRFFIAEMPAGQTAEHDAGELTDSIWISAADALEAGTKGTMKLHYPTVKTLESLTAHESVAALVAWADACSTQGVETIHPVMPGETR